MRTLALSRIYDADSGTLKVSVYDGYRDRVSKSSDIQEYLPFLYDQARSRPGCRVIELGVRKGNSTMAFLAGVVAAGGHVWSADIENVIADSEGMLPWKSIPVWTFIYGDDLDPEVFSQMPAECDILFIDTSHEYEHTLSELRSYAPKVRPGGIILCHDTQLLKWPGYFPESGICPVKQALDKYCEEAGLAWGNLSGEYGMGVIQVVGQPEAA